MKKTILIITSFIITLALFFITPGIKADTVVSQAYVQSLVNIPNVTGELADLDNNAAIEFTPKGNGHEVRVKHPNGTTYILASSSNQPLVITLPGADGSRDLILNSGILFNSSDNEQLIYYEFQNPARKEVHNNVFLDKDIELNGFRPNVIWNPANGEYDLTEKITSYGVHYAGTYRRAYVDILFDIDIDSLLMIELQWAYAYKGILGIGGWTDWRTGHKTFYQDKTVDATSFWGEFRHSLDTAFQAVFWPSRFKENLKRFDQLEIEELTNPTQDYKFRYQDKLNNKLRADNKPIVNANDLFSGEYSLWRIYLDTYDSGLWADYKIHDDITLLDLMYVYKGEYFHPRIEDVLWTSVGGYGHEASDAGWLSKLDLSGLFTNFSSFLKDKFGWVWPVIIVIIVIIILVLIRRFWLWIKRSWNENTRRY